MKGVWRATPLGFKKEVVIQEDWVSQSKRGSEDLSQTKYSTVKRERSALCQMYHVAVYRCGLFWAEIQQPPLFDEPTSLSIAPPGAFLLTLLATHLQRLMRRPAVFEHHQFQDLLTLALRESAG